MSFEIKKFRHNKILFPDGTMKLNISEPKELVCGFSDENLRITWKFENEGELIELMYIVNHLRNKYKIKQLDLQIDYLPQARMDRVYTDDEVFTLKYVCEFINNLKFDNVYILDPHSDVSLALLNNVKPYYKEPRVSSLIEDLNIDTLIFPDNGAFKKYSNLYKNIINKYNLNVAYGEKVRDWKTGKIKEIKLVSEKDLSNQNILVIDDICSRGGTFMGIYESLNDKYKSLGNIYLLVSHCEQSIKEGSVLDYYDKVFTFNYLGKKGEEPENVEIL